MTIQAILKDHLPQNSPELSSFWLFWSAYQANFSQSMAKLDRANMTAAEWAHYSILSSKPWRAYQLASAYRHEPAKLNFHVNAIEKQLISESVRNCQIGRVVLTMLALAATATAIISVLVIANIMAPALILGLTGILSMTTQTLAQAAIIGGGALAVGSYYGARQLGQRAALGNELLSGSEASGEKPPIDSYAPTSADALLASLGRK